MADVLSNWLEILRTIGTSASPIVVAIIGLKGLHQWQAQLKGTARYEVARRCLRALLATRDAIRRCRSPFMHSGEMAGRERVEGETREATQVRDSAYGYWNRLKEVQKAASDLEQASLEAEVLWGDWVPNSLKPLYGSIGELFATYEAYFELELQTAQARRAAQDLNDPRPTWRRILYSIHGADDEYSRALESAIQSAIAAFRPHLR